jgi:methyl coenzyme M reductase subunit C
MQDMTDNMTRVTLSNTTTTNTTTISASASSSSSTTNPVIDLTAAQAPASISSTLPLKSTSTIPKENKTRPKKVHTFDDYLIYILKWPVSLIDELGLNTFCYFFT